MHMVERCTSQRHHAWENYGGRGITVCARWRSFENFVADMGERPPRTSLDRIDNDRGYEPSNCRWASAPEQRRNTRQNVYLEHAGLRMTQTDWAARLGITKQALRGRLSRMSAAEALTMKRKER
jgi:hypothetical protein